MFTYAATVTDVYDGDTITVDIDLGFGMKFTGQKIRLYGINTPEVRGPERPEGLVARDWLRERILGKQIVLTTVKDRKGKYGRYLGRVFLSGDNINSELIDRGLAREATY